MQQAGPRPDPDYPGLGQPPGCMQPPTPQLTRGLACQHSRLPHKAQLPPQQVAPLWAQPPRSPRPLCLALARGLRRRGVTLRHPSRRPSPAPSRGPASSAATRRGESFGGTGVQPARGAELKRPCSPSKIAWEVIAVCEQACVGGRRVCGAQVLWCRCQHHLVRPFPPDRTRSKAPWCAVSMCGWVRAGGTTLSHPSSLGPPPGSGPGPLFAACLGGGRVQGCPGGVGNLHHSVPQGGC